MRKAWITAACATLLAAVVTASGCSKEDKNGDSSSNAGSSGEGGAENAGTSGQSGAAGEDGSNSESVTVCDVPDELVQCGATAQEADYNIVNMLLVIDKSGSMNDVPDGFDQSKWGAMRQAVTAAVENTQGLVKFGLLMYPYSATSTIPATGCEDTNNCCSVPSGVTAINVPVDSVDKSGPDIEQALNDTEPGGGTPTAEALSRAYDYFVTGAGASLSGAKYVLLATDGGPNCDTSLTCDADTCTANLDGDCPASVDNCCSAEKYHYVCLDDGGVRDQIERLAGESIPTFVVGIPGTEAYASYLDGFADAGGVGSSGTDHTYYEVSASGGVDALIDTFTSITTSLVRDCTVNLPERNASDLFDSSLVNVAINCDVVTKDDPDGGWEFDDPEDPTSITVTGARCDLIEQQGAQRIDIFLGCPTINIK